MLILASHAFAVVALTVAAAWDLITTEVPDQISVAVILVGIGSHGAISYLTGSFEPLIWSLGVGLAFSIYGWGMYFAGSWGGADAFVISALGFAAPYPFSGPDIVYPADLFVNVMLLGFLYAIGFAFYKALKADGVFAQALDNTRKEKFRFAGEIALAAVFSLFLGTLLILDPLVYFISFLSIILLYRFLVSVEEEIMTAEVSVSELEVGDVLATDEIEMKDVREENLVGILLSKVEKYVESDFVRSWRESYGYSEIVGVSEDEIQKLNKNGVEEVKVKTGIRFVPVFPLALFITDMGLLGMKFLFTVFN